MAYVIDDVITLTDLNTRFQDMDSLKVTSTPDAIVAPMVDLKALVKCKQGVRNAVLLSTLDHALPAVFKYMTTFTSIYAAQVKACELLHALLNVCNATVFDAIVKSGAVAEAVRGAKAAHPAPTAFGSVAFLADEIMRMILGNEDTIRAPAVVQVRWCVLLLFV